MRFESQPHPQDDHVDIITDCSNRYDQAPAVCTRVRLAKGKWVHAAPEITPRMISDMLLYYVCSR